MKCIHCDKDSKLSERPNGACPGCRNAFAFEPTKGDDFTDKAFEAAINAVSDTGAVRWLSSQLYFELMRRKIRKSPTRLFVIGFGLALALALYFIATGSSPPLFLNFILFFLGVTSLVNWGVGVNRFTSFSLSVFSKSLARWRIAHGKPRGIIDTRSSVNPPRAIPSELLDYSFDRALICDRDDIVDFFIANNFHFENNCAILGFNRYPIHAFDAVLTMLRRNPRLIVVALHDATPQGCAMAQVLAQSESWFKGRARVVDVGLRPEHAKHFPGLRQRTRFPVSSGRGISESDAAFLSKYTLALDVVRPAQLIKRVFRAFHETESRMEVGVEIGDTVTDFGIDAQSADGGADSFG